MSGQEPPAGAPAVAVAMPPALGAFTEYLTVARGASANTVAAYGRDVRDFLRLQQGNFKVGHAAVEAWLAALAKKGDSPRSAARKLSAVRQFYGFLMDRGWVDVDPTGQVPLPKLPSTLPKALSVQEVRLLLESPLGESPREMRLRLILQLLYATGLRVSELCALTLDAVDDGEGIVLRVLGKGDKTRLVPLGEVAAATLRAFILHARPRLKGHVGPWLFSAPSGRRPLTRQRVFQMIREAGERVGVKVAPHHLRHTFATHLLQNDADLRAVQLMLGHASLNTTQIYTKVAQERLRETMDRYHPLAEGNGRGLSKPRGLK